MNNFLKSLKRAANDGSKPLETIVTFLEMTKRPTQSAQRPSNINTAILSVQKPPLHFYRYLYFQVGMRWHWESRLRYDNDKLTQIIHADTTEISVLYVDGAPAGYFEIDRKNPEIVDLAYFGLMEHVVGRGLGRWFLGCAIDAAWESEPTRITVNTCTLDHPAALSLYQKMGFVPVRQAQGKVHPLTSQELATLASAHGIIAPPVA